MGTTRGKNAAGPAENHGLYRLRSKNFGLNSGAKIFSIAAVH
jgi:hypothetical protein